MAGHQVEDLLGAAVVAADQPVEGHPVDGRREVAAEHVGVHRRLGADRVEHGDERLGVVVVLLARDGGVAGLAQAVLRELVGQQVLVGVGDDVRPVRREARTDHLLAGLAPASNDASARSTSVPTRVLMTASSSSCLESKQ